MLQWVLIMSKNKNRNDFVFPAWANQLPAVILVILFSIISFIVFVFWFWISPSHLEVGYEPIQPIDYSHRLHAGELGIDCRYCHYNVERSSVAGVPPTEVCMNCHDVVKKESPEIKKIHQSIETNTPIEWTRVHALPDYVYFDHSRHVNSGVSCVSCHGRVDQMDIVRQDQPLSMGWCLDCHRHPEKHIRPMDKLTELGWSDPNAEKIGQKLIEEKKIRPREDCSICHR